MKRLKKQRNVTIKNNLTDVLLIYWTIIAETRVWEADSFSRPQGLNGPPKMTMYRFEQWSSAKQHKSEHADRKIAHFSIQRPLLRSQ